MKTNKYIIILILLFAGTIIKAYAQSKQLKYNFNIKLRYELNQPGDTLILTFAPQQTYIQRVSEQYLAIVDSNGIASFNIPQSYQYGYFTIEKKRVLWKGDYPVLADDLFWESGDDIFINIIASKDRDQKLYLYETQFSGHGATKYATLYNVKIRSLDLFNELSRKKYDKKNLLTYLDGERTKHLLSILEKVKPQLSTFTYEVLKTDIIMMDYETISSILLIDITKRDIEGKPIDPKKQDNISRDFLPIRDLEVSNRAMAASRNLTMFYRTLFNYIDRSRPEQKERNIASNIAEHSNGVLREAILTTYLDLIGITPETKVASDYIFPFLKSEFYLNEFNHIKSKSSVNINKYTLEDTNGNKVTLSQFNGKLILLDIWYTGCSGCIRYRKEVLSRIEEAFKNDDRFKIVSVSMDKSNSKWKNSISLNTYTDPNGINLYTEGEGEIHPLFKELGIVSAPTPILIDQEGNTIDFDSFRLRDIAQLNALILKYIK